MEDAATVTIKAVFRLRCQTTNEATKDNHKLENKTKLRSKTAFAMNWRKDVMSNMHGKN